MSKLFPEENIDLSDEQVTLSASETSQAKNKFLFFSLIGILFFLTPIHWNNKWTIGAGIIADEVKTIVKSVLPTVALSIVILSALLTLVVFLTKPQWSKQDNFFARVLSVSLFWAITRVVGAVFISMIYFQIGPEWIISKYTGGIILNDLVPTLIPFFFFAVMLLPFLTDYGLMEYIGTLLSKPFARAFRLPGRSAIDASASWLGAAPVGVLITSQQYDGGFYNKREAATIATNFSLASAAFCLLIAEFIGIGKHFVPFYLTVVVTGLIVAVIIPRLPPLRNKAETYKVDGKRVSEAYPPESTAHAWGMKQAIKRAHRSPSLPTVIKHSFMLIIDVYMGLMPVLFAIGTIALGLSEFTSFFQKLSIPLVPYLELLQVHEAEKAGATMLVGFADMFLPAVIGKSIVSEETRFIIASMSVLQIIYMTEVGALILKQKMGLNILELFAIFLLRTLICLPIVVFIAKTLVVF